jgi:hypothetical protein
MFLRNVRIHVQDCTGTQAKRQQSTLKTRTKVKDTTARDDIYCVKNISEGASYDAYRHVIVRKLLDSIFTAR